MKYSVLVIAFCFLAATCTYDHVEVAEPAPPPCNQLSHTWSKDIVPLLTKYCTDPSFGGCHQSGSQYGDWTDYVQFKYKVDGGHVEEHCLNTNEMPPPYSNGPYQLTKLEKQVLRCWIDDGALKN